MKRHGVKMPCLYYSHPFLKIFDLAIRWRYRSVFLPNGSACQHALNFWNNAILFMQQIFSMWLHMSFVKCKIQVKNYLCAHAGSYRRAWESWRLSTTYLTALHWHIYSVSQFGRYIPVEWVPGYQLIEMGVRYSTIRRLSSGLQTPRP
jgi:hypothetical protein